MALDPVEIEITMRQNVSQEADRASSSMNNMASSSNVLKEQIEIQKKVIADLEKQYAQAKAAFDAVNIGTNDAAIIAQREKASKLFREVRAELDAEKAALTQLETELNKVNQAQNRASTSSDSYMTQIRKIREEMQALQMAGQKESDRYRELEAELARVGTAYNGVRKEQRLLTTAGNAHLAGIMQGMTGVAGVFAAGQGAVSLFAKKNEDLAKIQAKLQAAMAITMGLQQVSNTLHATSAFRLATVTRLTHLLATANTWLATTLGISAVAANVLMATLTLGLSVAITGIIVMLSNLSTEQDKRAETEKKMMDSFADTAAKTKVEYEKLRKQWVDTNGVLEEKEKLILQNKEAYNKFGVEIKNVSDADKLFIDNAEAFQKSMNDRAMAIASMDIAVEKYKGYLLKIDEAEKRITDPSTWQKVKDFTLDYSILGGFKKSVDGASAKQAQADLYKDADKLKKESEEYITKSLGFDKSSVEAIKQAGLKASGDIAKGSKAFYEQKQKNAQALLDSMTDLEKGSGKWKAAVKEYNDATSKLKDWDIKGQNRDAAKAETEAEKEKKRQKKASDDLEKKTVEYQNRIDAARVAALQEGAEKQRAAIKAEYEKETRLIEQERKKIAEIEAITKTPATDHRNKLDEWQATIDIQVAVDEQKLDEIFNKEIQAIFDDVNKKFRGELENNIFEINAYYDKQIKAAKEAGATIEQIDSLNADRKKEITQAENQSQLKNLAFETDIAMRRMALAKDFYLFETDRIKEQLELRKKAKEEELKILQQQYKDTPTPELANEVDEATVAIAEMEKDIKKLSGQKFQEIAGFVTQISAGLSDLFGADSSAGKALGWAADFAEAGAKIASGDPKAMIEGTLQAAGTIKDIIATNAQANREIREFAYELQQAAISYSIAIIAAMKDLKSVNDSLFYNDTSNALTQGMTGYNAAVEKEISLVSKLGDTTVEVGKKKKRFLGVTTGTKSVFENILTGYKKVLDTEDELIDKNGRINKQIAESLLNSGKLSKEATNAINQILDAQEAAESAMAQVESTLENLAGSIGDDLKTALVDAFQDGGALSAAEKFKQSVSKTLEDIVTDQMFSTIFGTMLGDLEERMKNSYGMGGDESLVDDIMWFYKQSQEGANAFYEQLAKAKEQLKAEGIDILSDAEREGASKGIATASQDSINELNGGVYALRQSVNTLVNLDKESILIQRTQSAALARISDNTEYLRLLPAIKGELEDLNRKGVTLRDR